MIILRQCYTCGSTRKLFRSDTGEGKICPACGKRDTIDIMHYDRWEKSARQNHAVEFRAEGGR